jgi:hypothetical protein
MIMPIVLLSLLFISETQGSDSLVFQGSSPRSWSGSKEVYTPSRPQDASRKYALSRSIEWKRDQELFEAVRAWIDDIVSVPEKMPKESPRGWCCC